MLYTKIFQLALETSLVVSWRRDEKYLKLHDYPFTRFFFCMKLTDKVYAAAKILCIRTYTI